MMLENYKRIFASISFLFILLSVLMLTSCEDNSPPITPELPEDLEDTLATILIPEHSFLQKQDVWFFLSDEEGNLLGTQRAVRGTTLVFKRPEEFKGTTFSLNKLTYTAPDWSASWTGFWIESYAGISPGEFDLAEVIQESVPSAGNHEITITDMPEGYFINPNGQVLSSSSSGSDAQKTVSLAANPGKVLYYLRDFANNRTKVPRFKYFDEAGDGQSETVSFNDLPQASSKVIDLGLKMSSVYFSIAPHILPGKAAQITDGTYLNGVSSVKVFHFGDLFNTYTTQLNVSNGSSEYYYRAVGQIPSTMKILDASIVSLESSEEKLTLTTSGNFDYASAECMETWNTTKANFLNWDVYMGNVAKKEFNIPSFPQEIIDEYPELGSAPVTFQSIHVHEADNLDGYNDFVSQTLQPGIFESAPQKEYLTLAKWF